VKYPDECPVFDVDGMHLVATPSLFVDGYIMIPTRDVDNTVYRQLTGGLKPLTRAARELVRWSRQ
jgi:hypothetical protein